MHQVIEAVGQGGFWGRGVTVYDVSVTVRKVCDRKYYRESLVNDYYSVLRSS
jgi:hypothetical protein